MSFRGRSRSVTAKTSFLNSLQLAALHREAELTHAADEEEEGPAPLADVEAGEGGPGQRQDGPGQRQDGPGQRQDGPGQAGSDEVNEEGDVAGSTSGAAG